MSDQLRQLEPSAPWNIFADLNAIPRASKKEQRIAEWVREFGLRHGLEVLTDNFGNVIIKKPASPGREKSPVTILQGHLDMVHSKNADVSFDFDRQGIEMYIDGDWVRARGTTLGADNGLGVASILAVLASKDISHPPLEALFTLDEEQGLGGAKNLGRGLLQGKLLLNLDTEEDHVFTIGCAGGIDTLVRWNYREEPTPENLKPFLITVSGLRGGHSGMEIHLGRANANKILTRVLMACAPAGLRLSDFDGGNLRNEIPREAKARVAVKNEKRFAKLLQAASREIAAEFVTVEPNLKITATETPQPANVMRRNDQVKFLNAMRAVHNGVYRMSPEIPGLVEASSNLAKVTLANGVLNIGSLQRSSVESSKADVAAAFRAPFDLIGAGIQTANEYPGWKPNPASKIVKKMEGIYQRMFGTAPTIEACHAGLECGIIGEAYPRLDMVSFGPLIQGAHSPDERASVSSYQKFWKFYLEVLRAI
ncbi:MAG: aminoacyl-histidine dipeptidase [Haliscomenobacteraceae bacterium CHB4]|nr:Cytosol non-specific dipeptidase [Saprospiraceae bacterium]MCE7922837.1 aminoacyl-histidine dipeptidase [Haliscomenobacteraceae bacterium CHB4]